MRPWHKEETSVEEIGRVAADSAVRSGSVADVTLHCLQPSSSRTAAQERGLVRPLQLTGASCALHLCILPAALPAVEGKKSQICGPRPCARHELVGTSGRRHAHSALGGRPLTAAARPSCSILWPALLSFPVAYGDGFGRRMRRAPELPAWSHISLSRIRLWRHPLVSILYW